MNPGKLNNRIEIWGNEKIKNEVGAEDVEPKLIKEIWADIISLDSNQDLKQGEANTKYSDAKFKVRIRYNAYNIKEDHWIVYKDMRFDIKYILPDFKHKKFKDIFCNVVTE